MPIKSMRATVESNPQVRRRQRNVSWGFYMLNAFFLPGIYIMSRLRFALKLGLIGLLFLVPITTLIIFFYQKLESEINATEKERLGVQLVTAARTLVQLNGDHRIESVLSLDRKAESESKAKLMDLEKQIDEKLQKLSHLEASTGKILREKSPLPIIIDRWHALKLNNLSLSPLASFRAHTQIIDKLYEYMRYVSDKTGMTQDPETDSYYVINAAVFKIPTVLSSASRLRDLAILIVSHKELTPEQKIEVTVFQKFFAKDFSRLQSDYKTAISANQSLAASVGVALKDVIDLTKIFVDDEVSAIAKGDFTIPLQTLDENSFAARMAVHHLFVVSLSQFDALLAARLQRLRSNMVFMLGVTGLTLLLVLYLFGGMLLSVLRSLNSIEIGMARLAEGDVSSTVNSLSTDELCTIGGCVNSVAATLQEFTKAQLAMARAHNEEGRTQDMRTNTFPGAYGDMARNLNAIVGYIDEQNKILLQQKTIAEHALKSKSEFLSNMSHELRTPMHAILSFAQFGIRLSSKTETEKELKYFKTIHASGKRLLCLLNDLLDLSKLEAGKMTVKRISGDFMDVIKHVEDELGSLLDERGITLKTEMLSKNAEAVFDKQRMIQVLVNLLSNSIKFSPPGSEIRVTLKDSALPSGADALRCSVSDEGPGIPDGELEAVFEKFVQSSLTKTSAGGTGLGLPICRQILKAHEGHIWAENRKPNGALFSFVIPKATTSSAPLNGLNHSHSGEISNEMSL